MLTCEVKTEDRPFIRARGRGCTVTGEEDAYVDSVGVVEGWRNFIVRIPMDQMHKRDYSLISGRGRSQI